MNLFFLRKILFCLLLLTDYAYAQRAMDFNNGGMDRNPEWSGDTAQWQVVQKQLVSRGSHGKKGITSISTPVSIGQNTEWTFYVNLKFKPTVSNYADIFLISDSQDVKGKNQGYFIRVGGGSREVALFLRSNGGIKKLVSGKINSLNSTRTNPVIIKVQRDANYLWVLNSDYSGTGNHFQQEGSVRDSFLISNGYFGINIHFTASHTDKFVFDKIRINVLAIDTVPASILQVSALTPNQLLVFCSKNMDQAFASELRNYSLDGDSKAFISALRDASDWRKIYLNLNVPMLQNTNHTLTLAPLKNASALFSKDTTLSFYFYEAQQFDVVIHEIMSHSKEHRLLPKYEYIELYNKSERPVSLRNWSLTIGNSVKWISEAIIPAKDYLVLSSIEGADSLAKKSLHKTLGIAGFPQLPHDGNRIVLKNYTGHVISTVSYSLGWYNDSYKAKGGWSLEQIDAENPCGEGSNWKATLNPEGGTPGRKNSVEGRNPDTSLPVPDRITVLDEKTIILYFNKSLDSSGFNRPSLFSIDHNIGQPYAVKAVGPSYKSVVLLIQQALTKGLVYNLSIEADLYDCAGNSSVRTQIPFGIPEPCEKGDIIINEILFDPVSGSAPFLELRNRSSKILALNSLSLAKADPPTHIILSKNILQDDGFLLLPDEYIALTNDPEAIMEHYPMAYKKRVIYMDKFPSLNRSHGEVILLNNKEEEVDNFYYASSMHFQLLKSMKGVSLERRDPNRPTRDSNNWQSAAQQTGFATPGYRNSQDQPLNESTSIVSLDSEIFSPDNDGYNDVLTISLHSSNPNTTASMILFDATGRAVRNLIKNELIGSQSVYTWDGLTDLHEKARIGIYIIWVEIFDVQNGRITIQKLKCVLAEKI